MTQWGVKKRSLTFFEKIGNESVSNLSPVGKQDFPTNFMTRLFMTCLCQSFRTSQVVPPEKIEVNCKRRSCALRFGAAAKKYRTKWTPI